jgi:hypothetical protein
MILYCPILVERSSLERKRWLYSELSRQRQREHWKLDSKAWWREASWTKKYSQKNSVAVCV